MHIILNGNDIVETLKTIPALVELLPWWIKNEKELRESPLRPYMFIKKQEMPSSASNSFNREAFITISIVWTKDTVEDELSVIFEILEDSILWDIDWCIPITSRGSKEVSGIRQGYASEPTRDEKQNLILYRDYVFTYITQT